MIAITSVDLEDMDAFGNDFGSDRCTVKDWTPRLEGNGIPCLVTGQNDPPCWKEGGYYLALEVADVVDIGGCTNARTGTVLYRTDSMELMTSWLQEHGHPGPWYAAVQTLECHGVAIQGDDSTVTATYSCSIIAGCRSTVVADDDANVIVGDDSHVYVGKSSKVLTGRGCRVQAGDRSMLVVGPGTQIETGYGCTVLVEDTVNPEFEDEDEDPTQ